MNRAVLGLVALLLLLFCLPWSALALFGVLGAFAHESEGVCFAGRPLWAIGQLVVAIPGLYLAGREALAALATAAQERQDVGRRWLGIGYALVGFAAWALVIVLEPDSTRVATAECA
jgi:hypothetical protein